MRLHFDAAAADPEQQLLAGRRLHPHFAGFHGGQERRMPRRDADLAADCRREDHRGLAGVDLALGADDIDVDRVRHDQVSVFAFSTASSMPPTM